MPRISREELARLGRELTDTKLERDGLRRSLESVLKGDDGFVEVWRTNPTPFGERLHALDLAVKFLHPAEEASRSDAIEVAKLFEAYLTGQPSPNPPVITEDENQKETP